MQYDDFREKVKSYPIFSSQIFPYIAEGKEKLLHDRISEWVKKGRVIKLRQGFYTLNDDDRTVKVSRFFLAQKIYFPSYISLETALSYYGFIPERVNDITSVTTRKTQRFANHFGNFTYNKITVSAFDDFILKEDENGYAFKIAVPEKALLDFLYFKTRGIRSPTIDIFEESFRFQDLSDIDLDKLLKTAKKYNQTKLMKSASLLAKYIAKEWK